MLEDDAALNVEKLLVFCKNIFNEKSLDKGGTKF